jgi:hypothetical protein
MQKWGSVLVSIFKFSEQFSFQLFFIFKLGEFLILFSVLDSITTGFDSKIQNIKMDNGKNEKNWTFILR